MWKIRRILDTDKRPLAGASSTYLFPLCMLLQIITIFYKHSVVATIIPSQIAASQLSSGCTFFVCVPPFGETKLAGKWNFGRGTQLNTGHLFRRHHWLQWFVVKIGFTEAGANDITAHTLGG